MDLAELDFAASAAKGADVEIVHPVTRLGTGIFFTVIGDDADEYRRYLFEKGDKISAELRAMKPGRRNRMETLTTEQMMVDQMENTVFCVRGWFTGISHPEETNKDGAVVKEAWVEKKHDTILLKGEELPFTRDKCREILMAYPVLTEQVREAIKSRALFTPDSGKS